MRANRQCRLLRQHRRRWCRCGLRKTMAGDHPRNTGPMLDSRRCGAKSRSGKACRSPAVAGKKRCRMHGGAPGSGAPRGNKNALKHGRYTREAIEERQQLRALLRQSRSLIQLSKQPSLPTMMRSPQSSVNWCCGFIIFSVFQCTIS